MEGDRSAPSQPKILYGKKSHRRRVGERRGHGGPRHIQVETKNQHWVQDHVQDPAEHHTCAGRPGVALAAQQMSQGQTHHGGHASQHHDPYQVVLRVAIGVRTGPQKGQQRPPGQKRAQGEAGGHRRSAPDAERRDIFDVPVVLHPQHSGDQAAASQAEQVAQSREQVKPGRHQGHRRHHIGVPNLSHKKGVRQVVNHRHHLADYRRDCQGSHRPWDRGGLKKFFF